MSIGAAGRGSLGLGAPANNIEFIISPASVSFTLSVHNPTVTISRVIDIISVSFNMTSFPPTITTGPLILLPSVSFTLNTFAPLIIGSNIIHVPSESFTLDTFPPEVFKSSIISLPSESFTLTSYPPEIIFKSKSLERTVNVSSTKEAFIILLRIEHSSLTNPILVSNDSTQLLPIAQVKGTVSNGLEYIYLPFDFILPNQEETNSPVARLQIDNVSREIATVIDSLSSSPAFNIQVVLSSTPDIVELELLDFSLKSASWNISQLTGDITVESFDKEPYPSGRFNPSSFPALFNN